MAVIQDLENEFADRVIDRGGLKLFRPADAAEYVARCAEHGIEVLGIDGFRLSGESIQPLMEHSVDLSLLATPGGHHYEATVFLTTRLNSGLRFEIVVER